LLKAVTWADSPNEAVLADVVITAQDIEKLNATHAFPFATLKGGVAEDRDILLEPDRALLVSYLVTVVQAGFADRGGQSIIVGANRQSLGKSSGRGTDEIIRRLRVSLGRLIDSTHGLQAVIGSPGSPATAHKLEIGVQGFVIDVFGETAEDFYHPPVCFRGTAGVGSVALAWSLPPTRFDTIGGSSPTMVLNYKAGSTAPTSATDGTATSVALSAGDTTKTVALAAGTYTFALWAPYDDWVEPPTTPNHYSAAATVTATPT